MNQESPFENKQKQLSYEVHQPREGIIQYIFPHVLLNINFNFAEKRGAPELVYAVYHHDPKEATLDKPSYKIPGVDMNYVAECVKTMANDIGEERFWVHPYNEDALGGEHRLQQWKKHFKAVEPAPEHGYYMYI